MPVRTQPCIFSRLKRRQRGRGVQREGATAIEPADLGPSASFCTALMSCYPQHPPDGANFGSKAHRQSPRRHGRLVLGSGVAAYKRVPRTIGTALRLRPVQEAGKAPCSDPTLQAVRSSVLVLTIATIQCNTQLAELRTACHLAPAFSEHQAPLAALEQHFDTSGIRLRCTAPGGSEGAADGDRSGAQSSSDA